jgi:2-C-methyl-D-erythritol 4-phosphate cytidylyltransferase/2-C-methyl-D-erythritol 2,4-cyclodiphosphate synthase
MFVTAIIAAGGRGERLGGPVHKQLRHLGGRTVLERSVEPFDRSDVVKEIVVVLPPELVTSPPAFLARLRTPVRLVPGGSRRQDSVAAGLDAAASEADVLVIHDAARPFCTPSLVERTVAAAAESGAAIAAVVAQDTVKEGRIDSGVSIVSGTLPRERIFLAQTPQAFTRAVLEEAVAAGQSGATGTDEATLAAAAGHPVRLVEGDPRNLKITTEADLEMARTLATTHDETTSRVRIGLGYDLHRLVEGRRLVLGGVDIPSDRGLLGHSDADVVCHAVADAILGAANAGDIGGLFPDDDGQWKDASSVDLLRRAAEVVRDRGFSVDNVDLVVITDWPKIRDYAEAMRRNICTAMGIDETRIGLKGKTSEGVGAIGRGEAIEVHAVALLSAP